MTRLISQNLLGEFLKTKQKILIAFFVHVAKIKVQNKTLRATYLFKEMLYEALKK